MDKQDLRKEIESLRKKLNSLMAKNADYMEIYNVSIALDELLNRYSSKG